MKLGGGGEGRWRSRGGGVVVVSVDGRERGVGGQGEGGDENELVASKRRIREMVGGAVGDGQGRGRQDEGRRAEGGWKQ